MNSATQLDLDTVLDPKRAQFESFHEANPHVYEALKTRAVLIARRGTAYLSINDLVSWFRCEMKSGTFSVDGFKINDHTAPYYSRLLMDSEPELAGLFRTRRSRADR